MLLAFSAKSEELDILMLSLTFGNVEVKKYVYTSYPRFLTCVFFSMLRLGMEKVGLGLERGIWLWMDGWMVEMTEIGERRDELTDETTVVYAMWSRCSITLRKRGRGGRKMAGLRGLKR